LRFSRRWVRRTSETLVNFYQTTRRYNLEDSHIRFQPCLTPWSRLLFGTLKIDKLVKRFPTFNGIRRFIIVFTTAIHWSQMNPDHFVTLYVSRSILYIILRPTPDWALLTGFPAMRISHLSPVLMYDIGRVWKMRSSARPWRVENSIEKFKFNRFNSISLVFFFAVNT
jgi:hypothetical protein